MAKKYLQKPAFKVSVKKGLAGLGLFADEFIPNDEFVIEYCGPLLTYDEADEKGGLYLFKVFDTKWTIDGSGRDNLARYINHSCKPNCEPLADDNKIVIHSIRDIQPGEELTYDYGKEYMADIIEEGGCRCGNH